MVANKDTASRPLVEADGERYRLYLAEHGLHDADDPMSDLEQDILTFVVANVASGELD